MDMRCCFVSLPQKKEKRTLSTCNPDPMADFPVPRRPNRGRRRSSLSDVTTTSGSSSLRRPHVAEAREESDLERLKDYIASVQRTNEALILQIWESVLNAGEEPSRPPHPHNIPLPSSGTSSPT